MAGPILRLFWLVTPNRNGPLNFAKKNGAARRPPPNPGPLYWISGNSFPALQTSCMRRLPLLLAAIAAIAAFAQRNRAAFQVQSVDVEANEVSPPRIDSEDVSAGAHRQGVCFFADR